MSDPPTESAPTESAPTEPAPTDLLPTEPAPTDAAPADSGEGSAAGGGSDDADVRGDGDGDGADVVAGAADRSVPSWAQPAPAGAAYLVEPDDGPGHGVLVLHSWWGLTPEVKAVVEALADVGYTALAPDLLVRFDRRDRHIELTQERSHSDPKRHVWSGAPGWFSASYGPFRRFSGGDEDAERLYRSYPRLARHLTTFGESFALSECTDWLHDLKFSAENTRGVLSANFAGHVRFERLIMRNRYDPASSERDINAVDAPFLEVLSCDFDSEHSEVMNIGGADDALVRGNRFVGRPAMIAGLLCIHHHRSVWYGRRRILARGSIEKMFICSWWVCAPSPWTPGPSRAAVSATGERAVISHAVPKQNVQE